METEWFNMTYTVNLKLENDKLKVQITDLHRVLQNLIDRVLETKPDIITDGKRAYRSGTDSKLILAVLNAENVLDKVK